MSGQSSNNIKVHFVEAGMNPRDDTPLIAAGVKYKLFTAYPYIVKKSAGGLKPIDNIGLSSNRFNHCIMDSGLFTLMWGAAKGQNIDFNFLRDWMHKLCEFAEVNNVNASVVECDCQKLLSTEAAWSLRREMRSIIPNREIINVFHIEDGEDGFRRLVEFSNYIALSVPEYRIEQPKSFKSTICGLAKLARKIKPDIKIHLLGCTDDNLLRWNKFCTSADSSSWCYFTRSSVPTYGHHRNDISGSGMATATSTVDSVAESLGCTLTERGRNNAAQKYIGAVLAKDRYERFAGPQD